MWNIVEKDQLPESIVTGPRKLGSTYYYENQICAFRLWGEHIKKCWVSNDIGELYEMGPDLEKNIYVVFITGIKEGESYHYIIESTNGEQVHRRDPYARFADYNSDKCFIINSTKYREDIAKNRNYNFDKSSLIIYELHVESFIARYAEDMKDKEITNKSYFHQIADYGLPYISQLGFNCIELMPIMEYCGEWGYNPRLLMCIHSMLGSIDDFCYLVEKCHKNNITIIIDIVLHHGASKMNSLWNYDGYSHKGGIYFENGGDTGWGAKFSFNKKEIRDMLYEACNVLLGEYGVDGLRFDSVHNLPYNILKELISKLRQEYPYAYLIAEVVPENPQYVHNCGFDSCWIHSSYYDILDLKRGFKTQQEWNKGLCKSIIQGHNGFNKSFQSILTMLGNHDQIGNRVNGHIPHGDDRVGRYLIDQFGGRLNWDARAYCRMLYSIQCISFGTPMIFMGTENNQCEWWAPKEKNHCFNWSVIKLQDQISKEMRDMIQSINKIKIDMKDIFCSETHNFLDFKVNPSFLVTSFVRYGDKRACLCIVNMDSKEWLNKEYVIKISKQNTANFYGDKLMQIYNSQDSRFGGWDTSYTQPINTVIYCNSSHSESTIEFLLNIPKYSVTIYELIK
ncbi:alpha catalytic domain-containing protein [Cryptosporidium andersoni]|uniref:Alpha catalytic domain-containing protein n=1 Tax=Cryptosporidium andersoni TaxID=117008 RepID=A0A1J4MU00_9CRYT|nr:alpha catalytic domain-containing protein [Cryptosporidium andersoni]